MTILIVEDENGMLIELEDILKQHFKNELIIKTTPFGKSALEIAKVLAIDIFVIDINLPDMNGYTLAKQIRSLYKHQPIIFESAKTDGDFKSKIHNKIHNLAFLSKPYSAKDFISQVEMALATSKQLKSQYLRLTYNYTTTVYDLNNVIYVEKLKETKKIQVYWISEDSTLKSDIYSMTLTQLKKILGNKNHLCQIHRSFLINPSYIAKIDLLDNFIILKYMHTTIPIGSSYTKTLKHIC